MNNFRFCTRKHRSSRGFTLVEVMVATVLLCMIILTVLGALINTYSLSAKSRCNDQARFVIKALSDQFLTQNAADENGSPLPMFVPTTDPNPGPTQGQQVPLGTGMVWTNFNGTQGALTSDSYGYQILLGGNTGAPITATVTRNVSYLMATGGTPTMSAQSGAGGFLLRGDFTITYPWSGSTQTQTITNVRAVP